MPRQAVESRVQQVKMHIKVSMKSAYETFVMPDEGTRNKMFQKFQFALVAAITKKQVATAMTGGDQTMS